MKRRFKTNPTNPAKLQSSSARRFNGIWSSENRFDTTNSPEIKDKGKVKKVPYRDAETNQVKACGPNSSTVQYEAAQDTESNAPKTSEFAFFKKLKKDAGCRNSHPLHKVNNQLKNFESNDCPLEITNMSKHSCGDRIRRPSLLVEDVGHGDCDLFISPLGGASKDSEVPISVKRNHKGIRSPWLVKGIRSINHDLALSPYNGASKHSGTQCSGEEVFSAKRQKLRQWVADISCTEVENTSSEGCNLVSVLLSRLFPDGSGTENNHSRDAKPSRLETDSKRQLLALPKSDANMGEFNWTHRSGFMEAECYPHSDNFSSEYWSNRSKEMTLSKWDTVGCDSPSTSYTTKPYLRYDKRKPDFGFDGAQTATLFTECDPYFPFCLENYGSGPSIHLKELHEFQDPNEYLPGREPHALLLGWDFDNKRNVSVAAYDTEMNLDSTLATPSSDHQQNLEDRFNETELYSSSLFSSCPPNFDSLPHFHSANLPARNFGRYLIEDEKYHAAELNYFPLSLSRTRNCLYPVDDCNIDDAFRGSSFFLSPQNHQRLTSNFFSEKQYPPLEALLPSGLDSDSGLKCLSMSDCITCHAFDSLLKEGTWSYLQSKGEQETCLYCSNHRKNIAHFIKETLGSHMWSSSNYQISLDEEIARPLQIDSSRWVRSHDDDEGDPFDASKSLVNGSPSFY